MWHSFTTFWYFGPRTSWAVQMALFAPQLISLTCSGSLLYFTDGCLCGKVTFCQHIYKCPFCLHNYWKLISMVNLCAHFGSVAQFTEYKERKVMPFSTNRYSPQKNKVKKFKRLWKTMFLHGIQSDDLHLSLLSRISSNRNIQMKRWGENRPGQVGKLEGKKSNKKWPLMVWIRLQSAKKKKIFFSTKLMFLILVLPCCAVCLSQWYQRHQKSFHIKAEKNQLNNCVL